MEHQVILSRDSDLEEAAVNLFAGLRKLDRLELDMILAERFPDEGLGRAINDRLERASHKVNTTVAAPKVEPEPQQTNENE